MDGNGGDRDDDRRVVESLRRVMVGWGWTPDDVDRNLEKFVTVFLRVGILVRKAGGGYLVTELIDDEDVWKKVWELADKEGIGGTKAS